MTSAPARVVICSRERPGLLADTVRSVLAASPVPAELVVVDQSRDANAEIEDLAAASGECRVAYLHSGTAGASRARNIGLRAASSEIAVLLDDDMFVDEAWLGELLSGSPKPPTVIATGRVLAAATEGEGGVIPPAALLERDSPAAYRGPQRLDVIPGANVALPRAIVLSLGGYDERLGPGTRFSAAEDNDMGHRLLLAGCEVQHVPSAVVYHRAWRRPSDLLRLRWRYGRGKGAFYAKHASLRDRQVLGRAAADAGRRLRRAVSSLPRSLRTTASELLTLVAMLAGALDWLVTRRIPGAFRRRGD
jgi:GT2 family glycosyltransferase